MSSTVDADYYRDLLAPVFRGRRFLIIGSTIAGERAMARELEALGAEGSFLLGVTLGGPEPGDDAPPWRTIEPEARNAMEATWRYEAALADLPAEVRAAIDDWDPEGRAHAIGYIVLSAVASVAGRPCYASRAPAWVALEDKTRLHELLDGAGVRRGPVAVARAQDACLGAAHARLDRGEGTVFAGDSAPGVHGGASFVRRVYSEQTLAEACSLLAPVCRRVRVMPFIEGVPCSVHGLVFPEAVAVFRPVELITLRRPGSGEFVYAGTGSFWDPVPEAREQMREIARRVGEALRHEVDYRGPFSLDGVLGAGGFVPTEVNPRFGSGFWHLTAACPELPLGPLALAVQAGEPLDYRPDQLERRVLEAADANRSGSGRISLTARLDGPRKLRLGRAEGGGYRPVVEGEQSCATLTMGPSNIGGYVWFRPEPRSLRPGAPLAPEVVAAFAAFDALGGAAIGPLEACRCTAADAG